MRHEKVCEICKETFYSSYERTKTCGRNCRARRNNELYSRKGSGMASGTVGAMSEMIIAVDLMKNGYAVFRSLSPACFSDLIAFKDGRTLFLECRTGYKNPVTGKMAFPKRKSEHVNTFGVYVNSDNSIQYYESDSCTKKKVY